MSRALRRLSAGLIGCFVLTVSGAQAQSPICDEAWALFESGTQLIVLGINTSNPILIAMGESQIAEGGQLWEEGGCELE